MYVIVYYAKFTRLITANRLLSILAYLYDTINLVKHRFHYNSIKLPEKQKLKSLLTMR